MVVVRPEGLRIYAEIVEEFADHCRVRAQVYSLTDTNATLIRRSVRDTDVVLAVGQRAVDALRGVPARVVAALAFSLPAGVVRADAQPSPELTLQALQKAKPEVTKVGLVYSKETEAMVHRLEAPAQRLGIELVSVPVSGGPEAVRALRRIAPFVGALLLLPDLEVMTPQVFQYALMLQIQRALPLLAATRHQVKSGALLAYDADPRAVGRQAAEFVHQLLDGVPTDKLLESTNVELTVNRDAARRLNANIVALHAIEARIE